jgi:hypothetical protein
MWRISSNPQLSFKTKNHHQLSIPDLKTLSSTYNTTHPFSLSQLCLSYTLIFLISVSVSVSVSHTLFKHCLYTLCNTLHTQLLSLSVWTVSVFKTKEGKLET